jgi:hypothetical protein
MPQVTQLGSSIYLHTMAYPTKKFPLIDRGHTQEIDYPFRVGSGLVLRLPFTRTAVVVGRWKDNLPEEEALTNAIGARKLENFNVQAEPDQA